MFRVITEDGVFFTLTERHLSLLPVLRDAALLGLQGDLIPMNRVQSKEFKWIMAALSELNDLLVASWGPREYQVFVNMNRIPYPAEEYFTRTAMDYALLPLLEALNYLGGGCLYTWLLFYTKSKFRNVDFANVFLLT